MRRLIPLASALAITTVVLNTGCTDSGSALPEPADTSGESEPAAFIPQHQRDSSWYRDARSRVLAANAGKGAKNVVFFLGDGMGISTVTAARILAGQQAGATGEENQLSFEAFPVTALSKTYNVNAQTPDSAGTMSAIVTGVKTNISVFGIDENVIVDDCDSGKGHELISLLEIAELAGKSTGVVTTARLTHATPGATYAKTANRDWEDISEMSEEAIAAGCKDIALQLIEAPERLQSLYGAGSSDGIEVALGGGRRHFLPEGVRGGQRSDGRNLIDEWQRASSGTYVESAQALDEAQDAPLLGLFSDSHMPYALERELLAEQPSLPAMTLKALEILQKEDDGYLLIVEAGRIDHAHHAGNAANALNDTVELAAAVEAVVNNVGDDTLIMVTADHSHVFTMAGYPRRGNPILGKVVPAWSDDPMLDSNGLPYTTLGYMNGRGFRDFGDERNADATYGEPPNPGRQDISGIDTTAPGYHQEALVPTNSETHGGEDVAVYAKGPGSRAASGVVEQNLLFHVMLNATDWEREAALRLSKTASP